MEQIVITRQRTTFHNQKFAWTKYVYTITGTGQKYDPRPEDVRSARDIAKRYSKSTGRPVVEAF